jgi:chemotaxis protein CheD
MTIAVRPQSDQLLVAGIGDMVFSRDPTAMLVAYGLGSCVGLAAWDPVSHVGGLAHFMLPVGDDPGATPVKFVQGGFEAFIQTFTRNGGQARRTHFKAAGGASMLAMLAGGLEIGKRNAAAVQAAVSGAGLKLVASDFGGTAGRTVQLEVGTGKVLVKSLTVTNTL